MGCATCEVAQGVSAFPAEGGIREGLLSKPFNCQTLYSIAHIALCMEMHGYHMIITTVYGGTFI